MPMMEGMAFTIGASVWLGYSLYCTIRLTTLTEPMLNQGTDEIITWPDEWTVVTKDGKPYAYIELPRLLNHHFCRWPLSPVRAYYHHYTKRSGHSHEMKIFKLFDFHVHHLNFSLHIRICDVIEFQEAEWKNVTHAFACFAAVFGRDDTNFPVESHFA